MEEVAEGIPLGEKLPVRMGRIEGHSGCQNELRKRCGQCGCVECTHEAGPSQHVRCGQGCPHGLTAFCIRKQLGNGNTPAVGGSLVERGFELRSPTKNKQSQEQILQPGELPSRWESKPFHRTIPAELSA